jgi:hypothetical protein
VRAGRGVGGTGDDFVGVGNDAVEATVGVTVGVKAPVWYPALVLDTDDMEECCGC